MIKLVGCLRRKPGLSEEEFHRHWKEVHGPLVKSVPEFSHYVRKYVQAYPVPEVPGFPPAPFDGIAELWFDNAEDIGKVFSSSWYRDIINPDELTFLDLPNCVIFAVEETVLYE